MIKRLFNVISGRPYKKLVWNPLTHMISTVDIPARRPYVVVPMLECDALVGPFDSKREARAFSKTRKGRLILMRRKYQGLNPKYA